MLIGEFTYDKYEPDASNIAKLTVSLKELILNESFKVGEQLPSIRRLSKDNGISPLTARDAYRELELQGLVTVRQGSGAYVTDRKASEQDKIKDKLGENLYVIGMHYKSLGLLDECRAIVKEYIDEKLREKLLAAIDNCLDNDYLAGDILWLLSDEHLND